MTVALKADWVDTDIVVRVEVDRIEDFDAGQFDVTYDADHLAPVNVEDGEITGASVPVDMWTEIEEGRLRIIVNAPGVARFSGYGHLAKVEFTPLTPDGETRIQVDNGYLNDYEGTKIPAKWKGVTTKLSPPSGGGFSFLWIWPLLGVLGVLGLIASARWFSRNYDIEWR